jgi:UDP-GlcNAc:undecaprenyl-phosphate GlcNAc-1-phosphate transferase
LRFNFNPASIFLGDCGSLTVGFLLGCYGALWSQKAATMLGMTAPLMALAVPLLDTALAIARRFLRLQPIWTADKSHIHHRLLDRGLTQRKVVLLLYGAAGLGAVLSVLQSTLQDQVGGLVLVLFCAAAWIGVQHLGYVEFGVAGRMFVEGAFRRHLNNELALRAFEDDLATAKTAEQCWNTIREACCTFGFAHAELRLNGSLFADTLVEVNGSPTWSIQIPLMEDGYLRLTRCFGIDQAPAGLVPFAQVLYKNFSTNGKYLLLAPMERTSSTNHRSAAVGAS